MCLGIPGQIVETYSKESLPMAKVDFGGIAKDICLSYTPEAEPGQYVLVHVGFAISLIDEEEANEIVETIEAVAKAGREEEAEMANRLKEDSSR